MKYFLLILLLTFSVFADETASPTATAIPESTASPTATAGPTPTPTVTPTPSPTPDPWPLEMTVRWEAMASEDAGMPGYRQWFGVDAEPNSSLWFKNNILNASNRNSAEVLLTNIEGKYADIKAKAIIQKGRDDLAYAGLRAMDHGRKVIGLFGAIIDQKSLPASQIQDLNEQFLPIKNLLETGSLQTAWGEINSLTINGSFTAEDKATILAELENFTP
jgi:hypothetical protein